MAHPPRFGLFLAQHWHTWDETVEEFQLAEELGFDHAWGHDHFLSTRDGIEGDMLEAWTVLAGLAALTSRIAVGILVTGNTYRHPAMLAKQAVTVDHISKGRLILGIGASWHEQEHRMFGYDFPSARERVDRFEEAIQVLNLLMREKRANFAGRYYSLEDAVFEPKPVQQPRIPILVGSAGPRMLGILARYGDIWDTSAPNATQEKVQVLEQKCREVGRDPSELRRSVHGGADPMQSEDAYVAFVEKYRELGFTDFITDLPGPEHRDTVRRIATEVIPTLRR